ncbi:MAG: hypothetical protein Unbinned306contig1002_9 [Prokaryotic dsDNA virus sp.]|nr:MAG: hypothetical protein Unbinned306contig1002_9 [Prokaryotic dsDNA virus sp.]|tara:strand:- start:24186 stop:24344 length:159 start_codon:yes stop_codon:yes gene_type:complete
MKHKDWPYIKGEKQIIALTKAYEYNKSQLEKCKRENKELKKKIQNEQAIKND